LTHLLKLGSCDWNLWPISRDYAEIFKLLAAENIKNVELGIYQPAAELNSAKQVSIRNMAEEYGLTITAALFSLTPNYWSKGAFSKPKSGFLEQCSSFLNSLQNMGIQNANFWTGVDAPGSDLDSVKATLKGLDNLSRDYNGTVSIEYKADTIFPDGQSLIEFLGETKYLKVLVDTGHAFALDEEIVGLLHDLHSRDLLGSMHLGDALSGQSDADLPCGRIHPFTTILKTLKSFDYSHSINYDLYGAVTDELGPGPLEILRESHAYVLDELATIDKQTF
jgi:sugar phosphate isomerase/epimerase